MVILGISLGLGLYIAFCILIAFFIGAYDEDV